MFPTSQNPNRHYIVCFRWRVFSPKPKPNNQAEKWRKRALPGVRKREPIKRSRKTLLKKLVDYLRSDSYMFAPLISSPPKMFRSSPPPGTEVREPMRETKKKKLFKKIEEYLKSDSCMYALLLQSISPLP
ncbi:uncharacterized protein LOC121262728 [Juglans microcarpa x Juglans regia]|uniref:uncharacterized protein LOC121262728 n=1 Tax=Juglans microcarpa x Juglans regia TaxID=2249226 RepID=UPI001B7DC4CB|nr:uncharacterized protein LOC121262728 [Juglans microcarpa x Juglans regia]